MIGLKSFLCCFFLFSLSLVEAGTQSFSVNSTQAYAPATITFDASGINQAKKYLWTFGDGGTLTTTNAVVSYQYKTAGNFKASLSYQVNASDKNPNYKDAGSVAITILAKQQQNLPPTASLSCSVNNLLVNCNALASTDPQGKPLSFLFTYGDNFSESNTTGLSSHAFAVAGLYSVTLTVTNSSGLSSQATTQVQAVRPPNALPSLVLNCTSDVINTLSCNANGSTDSDGNIVSYKYSWDDNTSDTKADSANITHVFSTSASHTVTLTAVDNDGGVSTLAKSFTVKANTLPVANFACDTSKPQKVTCTSSSTDADSGDSIQNYSWKFGSASAFSTTTSNTDYDFKTGGTFDVTLAVTDSYGGVGSVTKSITVKNNTPPVANFSCSNTGLRTVHCASTSTDSDGSIASTSWSSDDGANLTGTSFDHTFNDDQAHTITLTVTDDLGASASFVQTVQPIQNQAPQLDVIASTLTGVAPVAINFTANALDSDGVVSGINWSFSDGGSDFGTSVSHTFSSAGTYTVTATATDNFGATTTKSLSVTINAPLIKIPPIAFFKVFEIDTLVELHATFTKGAYDIKRAYYTIDGIKTVEVPEFYHNTISVIDVGTFGDHKIDLTVVDTQGQQTTFTQNFTQAEDLDVLKPYADFTVVQSSVRTVFLNLNRSFDFDRDQNIQSFHIDYGNGETQDTTDLYAAHTYAAAGTYQITVKAISAHGTDNNRTRSITVVDAAVPVVNPNATFGYRIYDYAQNVSFYNDKSGTPNGSIISYVWDFGDGQTAAGQKVAHFYNPGSYFVTLTVTDSAGFKDVDLQHVTIYNTGSDLVANVDCTLADPFVEYTQQCKVTALDKQNQISKIKLTWGDGTSSNLSTTSAQGINKPTHTYANPGTYTVTETITTTRGETKTAATTLALTHYITPQPPVAVLNCSTNLMNVNCSAEGSSDPNNLALTYFYEWGDGSNDLTSNLNMAHTYATPGNYQVKLTVKNLTTSSQVAQNVSVVRSIIVASLNCLTNNLLVSCNALGSYDSSESAFTYNFNYSDGYTETNANGLSTHAFSNAGLYIVYVVVSNVNGDQASTQAQLQMVASSNQLPIPNLNCYSDTPYKLKCRSNFSSDSDGVIVSYKYDWDDNGSEAYADGAEIIHIFSSAGSHQVTLSVTDNDGGVSSVTTAFDVLENHPPVAGIYCSTPGPQKVHCESTSIDPDPNDMFIEYKWDLGDGTVVTSMIPSVDYTYSASSTYTISLQVKDTFGAIGSISQSVTTIENQAPVANINCFATAGATYQCNSNAYDSDGQIVSQVWMIDGQKISGSTVMYEFTNGGDYPISLIIKDDLGKIASYSKTIHIDKPIVNFSCNETSPFHIKCSYAQDPADSKEIIQYRFEVDDKDLFTSSSFEYDFLLSGSHKIFLETLASDGTTASITKTIIINPVHLSPQAIFKSFVDISLKVNFNASESFMQERKIVNFSWDFGDGSTAFATEGIVSHNYSNQGSFNVALTVTDDLGQTNTFTNVIYVYDAEVSDPGPANDDTIEGLDLDGDGIRDDIQRWINFEAKSDLDLKSVLRKLASKYDEQISKRDNIASVQSLENDKNKIKICLLGKLNDDVRAQKIEQVFTYLFSNTEQRSLAWSIVQGDLSGTTSEVPSTDQVERLKSCEGI